MKFYGVHLFVRDMAASLAFYRRLGLKFRDGSESEVHVALELAGGFELSFGTLALTRSYDPGFREPGGGSPNSLQFEVAERRDVDRIYAELTSAGYAGHPAPHDAFWGARYAVVDDPDANVVGFQSLVDPAKRSAGPALSRSSRAAPAGTRRRPSPRSRRARARASSASSSANDARDHHRAVRAALDQRLEAEQCRAALGARDAAVQEIRDDTTGTTPSAMPWLTRSAAASQPWGERQQEDIATTEPALASASAASPTRRRQACARQAV
jgi:catechol 2,3-dioxygenase-like lactoylglutathione lyase family enzyme